MKQFISTLLVFLLMFTLCACGGEKPNPTTSAATQPTTASAGPVHCHSYRDADCVTPKTCTDCGITRGDALGHDYTEGVCSRCDEIDSTYVALPAGAWGTEALNETGSQLECVTVRFREDGTATFSAEVYSRLSDIPEDEREDYMLNEENWYDYSGVVYYNTRNTVQNTIAYTVDGDMITCTLVKDDIVEGTMILERTSGNMLTVTYYEGAFVIAYLRVGDVFSCQT